MLKVMTTKLVFPLIEAKLHREGATPEGYPRFRLNWPRVGRIPAQTVYLDRQKLWAVAESLNRLESYYQRIPDDLVMALWSPDAPRATLQCELRQSWAWDMFVLWRVCDSVVRYDSVGKGEQDRTGVMHSIYIPKEILDGEHYPAELLSVLKQAPPAVERLGFERRF